MQLKYANGWGVSIICNPFSYGGEMGLYELAVMKDGRPHYANPVAQGDVCGFLSEEEAATLASTVESWKQDQVFPEWEDEEE